MAGVGEAGHVSLETPGKGCEEIWGELEAVAPQGEKHLDWHSLGEDWP